MKLIIENKQQVAKETFLKIVYAVARKQKGSTLDFNGQKVFHKKGYYASYFYPSLVLPIEELTIDHIDTFLTLCEDKSELSKDIFLGFWIHNDMVFIDLSKHIATKKEAINFGKLHSQKAIWDIKNNKEIML